MGMAMELSRLSPRNWLRREEPMQHFESTRELMPVSQLHRDIDRWFDEFMHNFGMPSFGSMLSSRSETPMLRPQLDLVEGKDAYTITLEVPGVSRDDIAVELRDGVLVISGEKRREQRDEGEQVYRVERSYGRFARMLELPDDADRDRIEARYEHGVLRVTVPRDAEKQKPQGRRIEIRTS